MKQRVKLRFRRAFGERKTLPLLSLSCHPGEGQDLRQEGAHWSISGLVVSWRLIWAEEISRPEVLACARMTIY